MNLNRPYTGRMTVPALWDRETGTIVSNESSEIIRMFNDAFADVGAAGPDFYPEDLRNDIDDVNAVVYETVNNGVYRAGFATSQEAYDEAFDTLFATLDDLDARLSRQRYLAGDRITEADWRLFTTLVRFDPVYHGHFKCNRRRLVDYPNLWPYVRELYQVSRRRRDGAHGSHHVPLLRQPPHGEPDGHRAQGTGHRFLGAPQPGPLNRSIP